MRRFSFLKTPQFLGILLLVGAVILFAFSIQSLLGQGKVLSQSVTGEGNCVPTKEMSGATVPNFDCREGGSASVTLKACIPESCPLNGATVEFEKTIASCPGRDWAGCGGACGAAATKSTLTIPAGQRCIFETIHCSPPESCGSCQVDIDGYGVRRWQKAGCPKLTKVLLPTVTPVPTNTPGPTQTLLPTATNTPEPTATNAPGPAATATPMPPVLGVSEIQVLPKTGLGSEGGLAISLLGVVLSLLAGLI
jgi:hypothetical protein